MMKALAKYLKNRNAALFQLLEKPRRYFTPTIFHQLRLEIKKLNALCDLIKFCSKDFKRKKTLKPFKQLFRQAGTIRELQIEAATLKKYISVDSLNEYNTRNKKLLFNEREDFFLRRNKKFKALLKHKFDVIRLYVSIVKKKKINSYLEDKKNSIEMLLRQDTLQVQELHEIRKRIKTLNFNWKSLSSQLKDKWFPKKDDLPVLLGKWHDGVVISTHLKNTIATCGINSKELNQLKKIKTKITADSELLLIKIKDAIAASVYGAH